MIREGKKNRREIFSEMAYALTGSSYSCNRGCSLILVFIQEYYYNYACNTVTLTIQWNLTTVDYQDVFCEFSLFQK